MIVIHFPAEGLHDESITTKKVYIDYDVTMSSPVADPDFELRWGPGFGLLALPAFLPSVISSFFTQNKRGGGVGPLGPSPRSATGISKLKD